MMFFRNIRVNHRVVSGLTLVFTGLLVSSTLPLWAQEQVQEQTGGVPKTSMPASKGLLSDSETDISIRVDCPYSFNIDKGESQECFNLSSLALTIRETLNPKVRASVRLDPFGVPNASKSHLLDGGGLPRNHTLPHSMIDHYGFYWQARPALEVAIEDYEGAAKIPSVSGLSLASPYADAGWDQLALSVTYNLSVFEGMKVKFATGNGEGESTRNLDPQQYFAVEVSGSVIKGFDLHLGVSMDGNDVGSERYSREVVNWRTCDPNFAGDVNQGHSTQRLAVGMQLKQFPGIAKLDAGLGFQRTIQSDLNKESASRPDPTILGTCERDTLDLDQFFVEDSAGGTVNTVQRRVISFSARYRIVAGYFAAFDYESRLIDSGSVEVFEVCDNFSGTTCTSPGRKKNNLEQTSITFGGGVDLGDQLAMSASYSTQTFDDNYSNAYYASRDGKASDTLEVFNLRFTYNR